MTYLLLRFSSIGNVAMTVPVVASLANAHANNTFVYVAQKKLGAMFDECPNVHFVEVEFQGKHAGLGGMQKLYRQIVKQYDVDCVLDLQHNWKTSFFSFLFRVRGKKVYSLNKCMREKKWMVRHGVKKSQAIVAEIWRYADVFAKAGMKWNGDFKPLKSQPELQSRIQELFGEKRCKWLGIAPFAKYKSNMLPYRLMKEVIAHFSSSEDIRVFLFGAGKIESEMLRQWSTIFDNVTCVAGNLRLEEEFELMRHLDLMLCMDSANQHLASLVGLRAMTIWGGTHPALGYYGWGQDEGDSFQKDLACRPCSVNGTNECKRGDYACLKYDVEKILLTVEKALKEKE